MKPATAFVLIALLALCGGGCSVVLPMLGTAATMGVDYNGKNCPSRTFTCELEGVHQGVLAALGSMSMQVTGDEATQSGRRLTASAKGEGVTVDLTRLTPTTTKVDVTASRKAILRDGATAREIIAQVEEALRQRGAIPQGVGQAATARPGLS